MNNGIDSIYKYAIKEHGIVGTIDNVSAIFLIKEIKDSNTNRIDLKTIISSTKFKQGSLVIIKNDYYLVIDVEEQFNQNVYCKGIIRKAETFKINESTDTYNNLKDVFGIVDFNNSIVINGEIINQLLNEIKILIPTTSPLKINSGVYYHTTKYQVKSVDDTKEGLLTCIAKYQDAWKETKDIFKIETQETVNLKEGKTLQLLSICTKNGVKENNASIIYTTNNSSIANIDSTGLVTAIKEGSCNIISVWEGVASTTIVNIITDVVIFTPTPKPIPTPIIHTIIGADSIKQLVNTTYTISPLIDCKFELDKMDVLSASIISDDEHGVCVIKGSKSYGNVDIMLRAKSSDGTILAEKKIMITKR